MTALARPGASELPPKIGVHPRPDRLVRPRDAGPPPRRVLAGDDLVGMKWVAGFGDERRAGLPAINAVVVLNDPGTGVPDRDPRRRADHRRANGRGDRRGAPPLRAGARRDAAAIALVGAGVQAPLAPAGARPRPARLDGPRLRPPSRPGRGARRGGAGDRGHRRARSPTRTRATAVAGADVVVTVASFASPDRRQSMTNDWLEPGATVVPVDYATYCAAEVARDAALFLVDHRDQFLANRDAGNFDGYPDPTAMLGEAILAGTPRPAGRVVVTHLGVGLADLVFADAIVRAADGARVAALPFPARRAECAVRWGSGAASWSALFKLVVVLVILVLLARPRHGRDHDAARLAADQRHDRGHGPPPAGDGHPRQRRDHPDHRRRPARPVHGPGLRPRPGADVADGDLAPHRRRPAGRAVREEPVDRDTVHPDARLAGRGGARPRRDVAGDQWRSCRRTRTA